MRWNGQVLRDRLHLAFGGYGAKRFFEAGLDTLPLGEHRRIADFALPKLSRPGRQEFTAATLAGELTAALRLHALGKPGAPVLIYHHDLGDVPPGRGLDRIFVRGRDHGLTIYLVEAPFHRTRKEAKRAAGSLSDYLAMVAVSLNATERLLETRIATEARLRAVAGFGQGGYIANWHHALHDTADIYIPIMAGAAPAETFLPAGAKGAPARNHAALVRDRLGMDAAWARRAHGKVFPVLGSADAINRFDAQARAYGDIPIEVWNLGHMAGAREAQRLREKILKHIFAPAA